MWVVQIDLIWVCEIGNDFDSSVEITIDLICVAVENDLFLVSGSNLTRFFVSGHRNRLDIRAGIEIDLISVIGSILSWFLLWGSKLTLFWCGCRHWFLYAGGRNWFCCCVRSDNCLVLSMDKNLPGFSAGIAVDFVVLCGPKMACICTGDRLTLFLCGWSKLLCFFMPVENHFVIVWASNLTLFLCGRSILAWFQCGGSNLTWFQCRDRNWLSMSVRVDNDFVLVSGSKST